MVSWVTEHFEVVSPAGLASLVGEKSSVPRPFAMFTFDDGLRSNFDVAAPVLEEAGHRGWFFVNPAFAETPPARQRAFFHAHVRYLDDPRTATSEVFSAMTPAEVATLSQRGHGIGSHTLSHAFLARTRESTLEAELIASKKILEDWTGTSCDAFAWTFAWNAISDEAWRRVVRTYRFCFGACPGENDVATMNPHLIFRTNVETAMPASDVRLLVSGFTDRLWSRQRAELKRRRASL